MTSWTLRFIFDNSLKKWTTGRKRRKDRNTKNEYLENEKSFLDETKAFFIVFEGLSFGKKKIMKTADTSFKGTVKVVSKY